MDVDKSLDELELIAAFLHDVEETHGEVFNSRSRRLTMQKVSKRVRMEGISFLTKTLPRLGKALDRALTGSSILSASELGFKPQPGSKLPKFMGELFNTVLSVDGTLLPHPCVSSVSVLRQLCFMFYKLKLPYTDEQEQKVIDSFRKTEVDLLEHSTVLRCLRTTVEANTRVCGSCVYNANCHIPRIRRARNLLSRLFAYFDPTDILPRHGPGAVATKQLHGAKYQWRNISRRITDQYPLDAYFMASRGHVCDTYRNWDSIGEEDLPARVLLVPKDSRGPRLISCEPVDFQWVQQGLMRALVSHIEHHPLTRDNVRFTDQEPNRMAALFGSLDGRYSTLDLNEASDRVSLDLVRLLFPEYLCRYLEACRSLSTVLPNGEHLVLNKFAPMGSGLCFPILALTIWAVLSAAAPDADTRESIYVYGDDVIVPTAFAADAIEQLELVGLKINRDKSCTSGLFRESCGMDAFAGTNVTPVRIRTGWSSTPRPESYAAWIAYANHAYDRKYRHVYEYIVEKLHAVYGAIPGEDMHLACPSLRDVPLEQRPQRTRINHSLQKKEWRVWDLRTPKLVQELDGWSMLLRYFSEQGRPIDSHMLQFEADMEQFENLRTWHRDQYDFDAMAFRVRMYTKRKTSKLVRRWR